MSRVARVVMMATGLMLGWARLAAAQERTVLVSEMRIGNVATQPGQAWYGDFEYDLGTNTAAPAAKGQFAWPNNLPVPFEIKYDASVKYAWLQVSADPTHTIEYDLGAAPFTPGALTTLRFGGRAMALNSRLLVSNLALEPEGQPAQALTNVFEILPADGYKSAFLAGLPLEGGFKLRGQVLIQWDEANPPARSQLAVQMGMAEPPQVVSVQWEQHVKPLTDNPAAQGGGVRMFAERDDAAAQPSVDNQTVIAKATVVPPRAGVRVYFASYDVDDPTANTAPVDAIDEQFPDRGNDNRGAPQNGSFVNGVSFADTDVNGEARLRFVVTTNPGDNFRVAATFDETELQKLGIAADDPDRVYVPADNDPVLHEFGGRLSPLLTVWRSLHLIVRSMDAVGDNNYVTGNILSIEHRRLFCDRVFTKTDLSKVLTDPEIPAPRGRFENGTIWLGDRSVQLYVYGNGDEYVATELGDRFMIPFEVHKNGLPRIVGLIETMQADSQTAIRLSIEEQGANPLTDYVGGSITIAGCQTPILGVLQATSTVCVRSGFVLPFRLHDDDRDDVPSGPPDLSKVDREFSRAFIQVNPTLVPELLAFRLNDMCTDWLEPGEDWALLDANKPDHWMAYISSSFQADTARDMDPGSEISYSPSGTTARVTGGSVVYRQSFQELGKESSTVVHELGHAVGRAPDELFEVAGVFQESFLVQLREVTVPISKNYPMNGVR